MAKLDPKTYDHKAFEKIFVEATQKAQAFVACLTEDEELDDRVPEAVAGMVEAASTAVLGTWFELHRIADALEASVRL